MVQIVAALFYCKLGKILLQIEAASLLQIGANVVGKWGQLLQVRATVITK